ncbi:formyltransferase family protein [Thalassospira sp. SN3W]|uniref:formyltransferase family protein n=1 Tax=Thalassospira sp. SN3W TaxID=3035476 RepID=UPI00311AE728
MGAPGVVSLISVDKPKKRVLFLGYDQRQTRVIDVLAKHNCSIDHARGLIDGSGDYDLVVSFGYTHVLEKNVIEKLGCPIFNLHISYLPYNRGAHPNFWSFYDNTPSGVTIHLIDEGIDSGPIIYQRYVNFDAEEITFAQTYKRLIDEVQELFEDKVELILGGKWEARPQRGIGTIHFARNLPKQFSGWDAVIDDEIRRLDMLRISHEE